ncbi:MAG TPA: hypothetical protein VHI52_13690 [Verrucomicrobiae bacterium]|nr:hypothetical protein [Verrucomicrobiae bacterium]
MLPVSENLLAPFTPTSDQPWLTVTGATSGVVSFAFSATASNRTGHITVLGQNVPVTQTVPNTNPMTLTGLILSNHVFSLLFTNSNITASFTILTATNVNLPLSNWTVLGNATNSSGTLFRFIDPAANDQSRYYRVRSP